MHTSAFDLVVCGGGAIGLSIAWEAAGRGLKVGVFEKRQLGSGASWAGAGILPPGATKAVFDPLERLRSESHAMFPGWCERLSSESGIDVGFHRSGGVYLARSAAEHATLAANEAWWDEHGIRYQRLSRSELIQLVPDLALADGAAGPSQAWYLPDECQVRNPRYLKALAQAAKQLGVTIFEDEGFEALESATLEECVIATNRDRYRASRVCFAAGAWTPLLAGAMKVETEVFPVRGQMVLFKLDQRRFSSIINEGHRYLVPRDDGYVLAGSCEEEVGYDDRTTPAMIEQLSAWACDLTPVLKTARIERTWAGLRPGSLDGFPYLGELPQLPGCYVAAGHYRHGLHFSPITAVSMVDLMTNQAPPIDLTPFRVLRGKTYTG